MIKMPGQSSNEIDVHIYDSLRTLPFDADKLEQLASRCIEPRGEETSTTPQDGTQHTSTGSRRRNPKAKSRKLSSWIEQYYPKIADVVSDLRRLKQEGSQTAAGDLQFILSCLELYESSNPPCRSRTRERNAIQNYILAALNSEPPVVKTEASSPAASPGAQKPRPNGTGSVQNSIIYSDASVE